LRIEGAVMTDLNVTHANDANWFDALTDDAVDEIADLLSQPHHEPCTRS
jgi:hypothetical protein